MGGVVKADDAKIERVTRAFVEEER